MYTTKILCNTDDRYYILIHDGDGTGDCYLKAFDAIRQTNDVEVETSIESLQEIVAIAKNWYSILEIDGVKFGYEGVKTVLEELLRRRILPKVENGLEFLNLTQLNEFENLMSDWMPATPLIGIIETLEVEIETITDVKTKELLGKYLMRLKAI